MTNQRLKRKRKTFQIKFYENLLKESPNFISALVALGDAYTDKGFYSEGLAIDQRLAQLLPFDEAVHYNLACSLSLLGQIEESLSHLKRAVFLGYNEFSYILEDSDLDNLRKSEEFKRFFNKLYKAKSQKLKPVINKIK